MILIVDDHKDTRRTMARLLQYSGYAAEAVADGAAALEAMSARRPSLVFLDYNMPGMNGLDVLAAIRASPALRDVPVIMFTAIDGDGVPNAARRLGVQGFVRKGTLDWKAILGTIEPFIGPPAGVSRSRAS